MTEHYTILQRILHDLPELIRQLHLQIFVLLFNDPIELSHKVVVRRLMASVSLEPPIDLLSSFLGLRTALLFLVFCEHFKQMIDEMHTIIAELLVVHLRF